MATDTTLALSTIRNLLAESERVRAERDEVAARLAETDRRIDLLTGLVAFYREPADATQRPKALRNEIAAIFRDEGKPLHYQEIYRRLLGRGITVNGKDPPKTVTAHLSNDRRFAPWGAGIWGLVVWRHHPPPSVQEVTTDA